MRNLCDAAKMLCEVAALPFQAHANYATCKYYIIHIIFIPLFIQILNKFIYNEM